MLLVHRVPSLYLGASVAHGPVWKHAVNSHCRFCGGLIMCSDTPLWGFDG